MEPQEKAALRVEWNNKLNDEESALKWAVVDSVTAFTWRIWGKPCTTCVSVVVVPLVLENFQMEYLGKGKGKAVPVQA